MKKNLLLLMLMAFALQTQGVTPGGFDTPSGDFRVEMSSKHDYSMWYSPASWNEDSVAFQAMVAPYALKKAVSTDLSWESVTEWCSNTVEIPTQVTYYNYASEKMGVTHNVVGISANAFRDCVNITSISFSWPLHHFTDTRYTIGEYAFAGCSSLESIVIPDGADFTGNGHHFEGCTNLKSITLPSTLTNIGEYEFAGCSSLEEIVIPAGVKTMADFLTVFKGCTNLKRIVLPSSLKTSMNFSVVSSSLEEVEFYKPTGSNRPTYICFYGCSKLSSIKGLEYIDTSDITNMFGMFNDCSSLISLDVSNFNTSNVPDMSCMFYNCSSLTSLDLRNFNTRNVTGMVLMFYNCSSLASLDVSNFNTENATDMFGMFQFCSSLTSLDVRSFNTSNVTSNMDAMFYGCSSLSSLDLSSFNTSNVTRMDYMFYGCSSLKSLDVSNFDTSNVTSMDYMFSGCSRLTSLDLSSFNTSNVTSMGYMFDYCYSLTSLDVSNFNTSNVTDMEWMFGECWSLTSLDLSNFDTSNVTDMMDMFVYCVTLPSLNLSNFNTSNVTNMSGMFHGCRSLTSLDLSSFNTSNVTDKGWMFSDVPSTALLYLPIGTTADDFNGDNNGPLVHKPYNIVLTDADSNSTCEDLRLTDEDELTIITTPFTAEKVSYSRAFTEGQKSTVYLPFAFDASAFGKVYDFKGLNDAGNGITFSAISGTTNANTPYILKPNGTQITAENVLVERPVKMEVAGGNEFLGVAEAGYVPNGAFCYDASDGKLKKVVSDNGVKIGAGRGYFVLEGASTSAASKGIDVVFEDGAATGISEAVKANGTEEAVAKYNLQGQRVGSSYKGIVIVNGKKVMNKN